MEARTTNYGVVRAELLDKLYDKMYHQRRELGLEESAWPHRILGARQVMSIESCGDTLTLTIRKLLQRRTNKSDAIISDSFDEETIDVDLVIAATGYRRDAHVTMLRDTWHLLPRASPEVNRLRRDVDGWTVDTAEGERKLTVGRNYQVRYSPGAVADGSGVWLQGCCEGTHGVSDADAWKRKSRVLTTWAIDK